MQGLQQERDYEEVSNDDEDEVEVDDVDVEVEVEDENGEKEDDVDVDDEAEVEFDEPVVSVAALKRQALGRPSLGDGDGVDGVDDAGDFSLVAALRSEVTCAVCHGIFQDPVALRCGHALCRRCLRAIVIDAHPQRAKCPTCRTKLRKDEDEESRPCVALRNIARLVANADDAEDESEESDEESEDEVEEDLLLEEMARGPPPGPQWERLAFPSVQVYATRNVRRAGERHMQTCLGVDFPPSLYHELAQITRDDDLISPSFHLTVGIMYFEDDEAEEGIPIVLGESDGDALVATHQTGKPIRLSGRSAEVELDARSADLESGIAVFDDVTLILTHDWSFLDLRDEEHRLDLRLAFRLPRFDQFGDDEDDQPAGSLDDEDDDDDSEDEYDHDDGFIIDDTTPARARLRTRHDTNSDDEEDDVVVLETDAERQRRFQRRRRLVDDDDDNEAEEDDDDDDVVVQIYPPPPPPPREVIAIDDDDDEEEEEKEDDDDDDDEEDEEEDDA